MTEIPAPTYALRLLAEGTPLRKAADDSGLEVGQVVGALLEDWRKTRQGKAEPLTGPGWEQYLRHPSPKVVKAAERLRDTFAAEDERAALLAERQRLEAQLARVKAELAGKGNAAKAPSAREQKPCPDCGQSFANVGTHRARAHGYRAGDAA